MAEMVDRRKVARVVVPWHLSARVRDSHDVRILDLSTAGVGIEHGEPLQPGATCTLEFPLPFGSVHLAARVVWSLLRGAGPIREGVREHRYHSGLAFTELTSEQQAALARALETLQAAHDAPGRENPR
jgi:PilZ domain